ncbi:MAG: peptide-methionine (S)-S-oxide reductase MsrA [Paludibacteraceae bacterium]|nr:peptide-methionine (S)-S-oxide reductase MsrA [Paludibacteraceae bacterium]
MTKTIYFAGGCFWGVEHFFKQVKGVVSTETGFANGKAELSHPSYEQVYTDQTGFAETVKVEYDEQQVSFDLLLDLFFAAIDPTSLNKQGHDEGTRYRTGIYYTDESQRAEAAARMTAEQKKHDKPIVVELEPLRAFYPADEYHQDYLDKHPDGYCHLSPALFAFARKSNR